MVAVGFASASVEVDEDEDEDDEDEDEDEEEDEIVGADGSAATGFLSAILSSVSSAAAATALAAVHCRCANSISLNLFGFPPFLPKH